jgi:hypothetical protein
MIPAAFPDVRSMYESLFPGGELVGEVIALLRDSYQFLSRHIDPSDGGRAIVLAICSFGMSIFLLLQRRLGNMRSLFLIGLGLLSFHGTMVSLMGLPWFVYPVVDYLFRNGHTSALVSMMSALSMIAGWGQHCIPEGATIRQQMAGSFGFGSSDEPPPSNMHAYIFFGVLLAGIVIVFR